MSSRTSLMTECAEDHLESGDVEAHDAIIQAIDDVDTAKLNFPNKVSAINNAVSYADKELGIGFRR